MQIVVVGGGMQGRVIAQNLLQRPEAPEVIVADLRRPDGLPSGAQFKQADVTDPAQAKTLATSADALVLAVPSSIAHRALANLIEAGKPIVDVSFTPDPPLDLDGAAKRSGAAVLVDCGIAPGLSHILVGAARAELGGLDSVRILVGGMPEEPPAAFHHAVYFNAHDLLSEYVRPARARHGGTNISPAPLDVAFETHHDSELGHLQAFLSDGLRSLLTSFPDVPNMAELTLRWPGHLDSMKNLHTMGLLSDQRSLAAIAEAFAKRYPAEQYADVLLMVVEAKKGRETRSWRLIDRRYGDQSAMSRTTGYTTAAVAMLLARKEFTEAGVFPPEKLGDNAALVKTIIADLAERGIKTMEITPVL